MDSSDYVRPSSDYFIYIWLGLTPLHLTLLYYTHPSFSHDGQVTHEDHHQQQHREVEYLS